MLDVTYETNMTPEELDRFIEEEKERCEQMTEWEDLDSFYRHKVENVL